jgi:hypothetical protein
LHPSLNDARRPHDADIYTRDIWGDLAAGEPALTLNEVRNLPALRRGKRRPDLCTLHRWITTGARPADSGGDRVKLEYFQPGGHGRHTTSSAVVRFLRALSSSAPQQGPSPATLAKAHVEAERRLAAAGF